MRKETQPLKNRKFFINKAGDLISGKRADDYGDATESFRRIASIWSAILNTEVSPEQVAACMIGLKLGRLSNEIKHEDSWVDIIGYAALGGEASQNEKME